MRKIISSALALAFVISAVAAAPAAADREDRIGHQVHKLSGLNCVVLDADRTDVTYGTGRAWFGTRAVMAVCKATNVPNDTRHRVWLNYRKTGIECPGDDLGLGNTKIWWERIDKRGNAKLTCVWPR